MKKLRLGIIGIGNMGTGHYNNIKNGKCPEIEVTAIADINPDRIQWAKENMPERVAKFNTAEELMDSGLVDAIIVAVPHYSHCKYAMEGFRHNLHVMCEKPAGVYTKQVREMNQCADEHEVLFGMMFNQRTNHIFRKMKELVASGKYGEIRRTNWMITNWYRSQSYYDSGDWRATWSGEGGGVLLNQCPHQLDLWQWICGMPKIVDAKLYYGKWHDIEVEDDVTAFVEYENGATGVFITTTGDACGTNRFEIQMDKAKLVAEKDKLYVTEFEMSEQEFSKTNKLPFGNVPTYEVDIQTDGLDEEHVGVLNAFANAILHGGELVADGREGINGLTLSNAMHLSSFLGKPIMIPFDEDLYYSELEKRIKTSRRKENVKAVVADTSNSFKGTDEKKK